MIWTIDYKNKTPQEKKRNTGEHTDDPLHYTALNCRLKKKKKFQKYFVCE